MSTTDIKIKTITDENRYIASLLLEVPITSLTPQTTSGEEDTFYLNKKSILTGITMEDAYLCVDAVKQVFGAAMLQHDGLVELEDAGGQHVQMPRKIEEWDLNFIRSLQPNDTIFIITSDGAVLTIENFRSLVEQTHLDLLLEFPELEKTWEKMTAPLSNNIEYKALLSAWTNQLHSDALEEIIEHDGMFVVMTDETAYDTARDLAAERAYDQITECVDPELRDWFDTDSYIEYYTDEVSPEDYLSCDWDYYRKEICNDPNVGPDTYWVFLSEPAT